MKFTLNSIVLKALPTIAALGLAATSQAASVRVTGGGTSGQSLQIEILQDITVSTNSGSSFGGYIFGFILPGALTSFDGYYRYDLPTDANPPFQYVTGTSAPTLSLSDVGVSTNSGNIRVFFNGSNYPEVLIGEGGSITFKAGTVTRDAAGGNNVLANPGQIFDVTINDIYTESEQYGSFSPSGSTMTAVPEAHSALLAALGVAGAVFFRRRTA